MARHYYLLRHAHSTDGPQMDPDRTITSKGKEQIKAIRKFLKDAGVLKKIDCVISSPFNRALHTAQLVTNEEHPIFEREALEPDSTPQDAWRAVRSVLLSGDGEYKHILIVTHDPLIQPMLAAVCFQFSLDHNMFDHANIAHFDSEGTFHWFMTPKLAEKLREGSGWQSARELAALQIAETADNLAEALRMPESSAMIGRR